MGNLGRLDKGRVLVGHDWCLVALVAGIRRATNRRLAPCRSQNSESVSRLTRQVRAHANLAQYWAKAGNTNLGFEMPLVNPFGESFSK